MILYHSLTNGLLCNFVCVCPSACLWVHEYKFRCLQRPEDRISSCSTEVTSSCELSNSNAGNWILVLCWSSTLRHCPSPMHYSWYQLMFPLVVFIGSGLFYCHAFWADKKIENGRNYWKQTEHFQEKGMCCLHVGRRLVGLLDSVPYQRWPFRCWFLFIQNKWSISTCQG